MRGFTTCIAFIHEIFASASRALGVKPSEYTPLQFPHRALYPDFSGRRVFYAIANRRKIKKRRG